MFKVTESEIRQKQGPKYYGKGRHCSDLVDILYHIMSCRGRYLVFDRTRNSAIWSANQENPTIERNMKWIRWPVAKIWQFDIRITMGAFGTPIS